MSARRAWTQWRATREAELAEEHGWLSLTGFAWLSAEPHVVPGLPGLWWADDEGAHVSAGPDEGLTTDVGPVTGTAGADVAESGSLHWVRHDGRVVELLRRGGRLALRTRDPQAPARLAFTGVPTWDHDTEWVRPATFTPAGEAATVQVGTARGDLVQQARVVGTVDVDIAGVRHRLSAVPAGDGLALHFHDLTNGVTSAGWRSVVTEAPDPEGNLVVDFNRAVNLPFAFSDHGTCPAPVSGNRIAVAVTAGEQRPKHQPGRADAPSCAPEHPSPQEFSSASKA
ncbi:DUF1684 domain-containing protein [Terrabacter sp. 2RAF25]|uniref:DUF1684 domain-containing protein n=1 Tax=Terrabacter sp. 2RAF25 TaxID=3232998 RepID=UPI003F98F1CB